MNIGTVGILTDEALQHVAERCAVEPYTAEVITDKAGDAISIKQALVRRNLPFFLIHNFRNNPGVPGVNSGSIYFPDTGSIIRFRGVRQGTQYDADEILIQDVGRAGAYGRKIARQIKTDLQLEDELCEIVESDDDDLYKFIRGFDIDK